MKGEMTFAMDKNLGFVIKDKKWQEFLKKFNFKVIIYDDMKKMIEEMKKNKISLAYLSAATFFYFKADDFYTPIANALFAVNHTSKIKSLLIVSKQKKINSLSQLKEKTLGYINLCCTTSYFAPALLLWKNHYSIHHFFSNLKEVGAWQLQIDAVIKGEVDATMIQEDVWHKLPGNSDKTKIIAQEDNLPSPIILCAQNIDQDIKRNFMEQLFFYKPQTLSNCLFNGFIPFQCHQVQTFYSKASQAFS